MIGATLAWIVAAIAVTGCVRLGRELRRQRDAARTRQDSTRSAEQAAAAHRVEVARLRAGLGGIGDGILVLDKEQRLVAGNAAAAELTGQPVDRGLGRPLTEMLPWGQLVAAFAEIDAGDETKRQREFEFSGMPDDGGNDRALFVRVRLLPGLGYVIVIDDQSRLKQLESLRRDFVANVSHELKTPLAAIKGFVETMLEDADMPAATRQRFLERVATQSERLNSLVGDLLTLSRLDEVETLPEGRCDLAAVTAETVRDLQSLADSNDIDLTTHGFEVDLRVRAEREAMRQVIGNLIDNAIKYTPKGGKVTVRAAATADTIRLAVTDTGIGLGPEHQERVFERFYRVDRARSRELGGTGLGLSIVKNTVRSLGGEVGLESAVGRGSTFWVELPRLAGDELG
ncbi:MAG: PAS domain-containing protein [Planctomycetes bacterium]|nr:PAS domain-containing protein [Planctomycetota bacterium]